MTTITEQLAWQGEALLSEAVLSLLFQENEKVVPGEFAGLGAAEIGKRTGIWRKPAVVNMNDAIVTGLLNRLYVEGKVEHVASKWRLTEAELKYRRCRLE